MQAGDIANTLMYFSGPFFGNPVKPFVQSLWCKTGYESAYAHFKRDHTTPINVRLHGVALVMQLTSNFAFMHRLDELVGLPDWAPLSRTTALFWMMLLAPQRAAPVRARALALALIAVAYAIRKKVAEKWEWYAWAQSFMEAYQFKFFGSLRSALPQNLRKKYFPFDQSIQRFLMFRLSLQALLSVAIKDKPPLKQSLAFYGSLPCLIFASYKPFLRQGYRKSTLMLNAVIFNYQYFGWILSKLTGEKGFYLHSLAFAVSGFQGIAHYLGNQEGTLPQLNDSHYEFAHCSYFPVLAVQRLIEHIGIHFRLRASAVKKGLV